MFDGFFGAYALFGLVLFLGSLIVISAFGILLMKILKMFWILSLVLLIASIGFYFIKMTETSIFYLVLALFSFIFLFYKNKSNKNEKN